MKLLDGKPLIQHSIDFALNIVPKNSIWVNSDDLEIIELCEKLFINKLFRPSQLATDFTTTAEVLKHHVQYFQSNSIDCDAVILLQPTNPLREKKTFLEAIKVFEKSGRNSLATFSISEKKLGKIIDHRFRPINYVPGQRSQEIEKSYYENGSLYITKVKCILKDNIITDDVYPFITNDVKSTVDIDYLEDFIFAETLLKLNK